MIFNSKSIINNILLFYWIKPKKKYQMKIIQIANIFILYLFIS